MVAFIEPLDPRLTKTIQLSHFSMSVHGFGDPQIQRDYLPFDVTLSRDDVTSATFSGTFMPTKRTVLGAEDLTFVVVGVRFTDVHDEGWRTLSGPRRTDRCVWPISARSNRILDEQAGHFAPARYRAPLDPDDCCAPERVH